MTTALQMIERSMRLIGALGGGETPTATEQTDGLSALASMLDGWDVQPNAIYEIQDAAYTWTAAAASMTYGPSGDFNADRPVQIEGFYQRVSNYDYPITKITEAQYRGIGDKTTQSTIIEEIYPDSGFPLITLYAYPVPSSAATVHIRSHLALQSFTSATTALAMPPGYREAIEFNLALRLAPEYQRAVPEWVVRTAAKSLRTLKTRNVRVPNSVVELAAVNTRSFNINTG
jgi:hypothetical protein